MRGTLLLPAALLLVPAGVYADGLTSSVLGTVAAGAFTNAVTHGQEMACKRAQDQVKKLEAAKEKKLKTLDDKVAALQEGATFDPTTCTLTEKECKVLANKAKRSKKRIEVYGMQRSKAVTRFDQQIKKATDRQTTKCAYQNTGGGTTGGDGTNTGGDGTNTGGDGTNTGGDGTNTGGDGAYTGTV